MKNKPFDLYKFLTENKVTLGKYETTEQNGVYKGVSDIRKTNHDVVIKEGKFQLNTLKKSTVNESIDLDDYAHELQTNILKVVGSKKIAGWRLTTDQFSGTFEFYKKDKDTSLLATPMWEGESEIMIDIVDDGDPTFIKMIDFKPTFDIKKDTANYIKIMKKVIPALEKKYGSLQESINESKTIPVASPYEISTIFARFLIGDRKDALRQLDKYKNHSFGIVEPDNGEWLKQFDKLINKMEKAIKSEM